MEFTDLSNKCRHIRNICGKNNNNNNNKSDYDKIKEECQKLKEKNEELEKKQLLTEMKALEEKTKSLEKDKERMEKELDRRDRQIENMNDVTMSSMSALNYAIKYCPDAPLLSSIPRLTLKCIGDTDDEIVERVLYKQEQGILPKYACGFIYDYYARDDITQQSIHTSDVSRCTYLNKNKKWSVDKNGEDTREIVIRPLLFSLKDKLQVYIKRDQRENEGTTQYLDKLKMAVDIIASIDKKTLEEEIMKELAPSLYLKRNCHNSNKKSRVKIEVIDSDYDSDYSDEIEAVKKVKKIKKPVKKVKKDKETKYAKKSKKTEPKIEPKIDPKIEPKVEIKAEPKVEPKPGPKIKVRDPRVYAANYVGNLSDFDSDSDNYIDPYD
jgi:hypothetical protein